MATHNNVSLLGIVRRNPILQSNGVETVVSIAVSTIVGLRDDSFRKVTGQISVVSFVVRTAEKEMVDALSTWKENDTVFVQGFIATKDIEKSSICPKCGNVNLRIDACRDARSGGNLIYVYPIYAEKIKGYSDIKEALDFLLQRQEIANRASLVGTLVREPLQGTIKGRDYTRFQIASNRKYCAQTYEEVLERTDYPWIYSYGEKAKLNMAALHTDSLVLVDGALQGRYYKEVYQCQNPECNCIYTEAGTTLEILAYDTEFLEHCDLDAALTL